MTFNNEALMAAAAQMLQSSGPSRTPVGLGQILGGGMSTYMGAAQAAKQRELQEAQEKQMAEMRAMQMQEMQGTLSDRAMKRSQAQKMMDYQSEFSQRGAATKSGAIPNAPPSAQGPAAGEGMPAPMGQPAPQAAAKPLSPYQSAMEYATFLQSKGEIQQAIQVAEEAQKLRPKVKAFEKVHSGGKVLYAPFFEDGTSGDPVPLEVAEKLEKVDRGNATDLVNPYTGKAVTSLGKSVSPDSQLSAQVQMRGQNMTDRRAAQEIAAGGKPPPGYRWTPEGTLAAIPGGPGDKLPESQQKQVVGVNNLSNAIREYRADLANFGKTDALTPDGRARMGTKYNNMMLQAKEAYNLGVLNGPDLEILTSVITDPRSVKGMFTSKAALDSQASELDRIMQGVGAVSGQSRQPQNGGKKPAVPMGGGWSIKRKD